MNKAKIFIASSLFSILVLEFVLHIIGYPNHNCETVSETQELYMGQFDPYLGWSYKKNASFKIDDIWYHFDDNSMRVNSQNTPSYENNSTFKILFIGDSMTFGHGIKYEDTFPAKISQKLGPSFQVYNAAVQGFGTDQSMITLRKYYDEIKPDLVVYLLIYDHLKRNFNYDRRQLFECIETGGSKPLFEYTNNNLRQTRFPKSNDELDIFKTKLFFMRFYDDIRYQIAVKTEYDHLLTKELIHEIKNISAGNAKFIFYDVHTGSLNQKLVDTIFGDDKNNTIVVHINPEKNSNYFVDTSFHPSDLLNEKISDMFIEEFFNTKIKHDNNYF